MDTFFPGLPKLNPGLELANTFGVKESPGILLPFQKEEVAKTVIPDSQTSLLYFLMNDCSPQVRHCFLNPQNVGDLVDATTIGRVGSYICGATIRISLRIDQEQRITDARFKAAGCSVLVATASSLTNLIRGKTSGEAAALAQQPASPLLECLGEPPPGRQHCAGLAGQAVVAAITSYSDATRDRWVGNEALICTCFCVSEGAIEEAITKHKLRTIDEVTKACGAGGGCRSCYSLIEDILASQVI